MNHLLGSISPKAIIYMRTKNYPSPLDRKMDGLDFPDLSIGSLIHEYHLG